MAANIIDMVRPDHFDLEFGKKVYSILREERVLVLKGLRGWSFGSLRLMLDAIHGKQIGMRFAVELNDPSNPQESHVEYHLDERTVPEVQRYNARDFHVAFMYRERERPHAVELVPRSGPTKTRVWNSGLCTREIFGTAVAPNSFADFDQIPRKDLLAEGLGLSAVHYRVVDTLMSDGSIVLGEAPDSPGVFAVL